MRYVRPKSIINKFPVFACNVFTTKREEESTCLNPRHCTECLRVTLKVSTDSTCTYTTHAKRWKFEMWSSRKMKHKVIWQHRDTWLATWGAKTAGICHQKHGYLDKDKTRRQGTSTAMKDDCHDTVSRKIQETSLRREASEFDESALEEGILQKGSQRGSDSREGNDRVDVSATEVAGFY